MTWSQNAWKLSKDIISNIENCLFVTQLANGSLDTDKFIFYIEQDNIYLQNFSERLKLLHSQIEDEEIKTFILANINGTLEIETGLHAYIESTFNTEFNSKAPLTPSNKEYNKQTEIVKSANNPALTFASLLPCFWVYAYIGKTIYDRMQPENPFSSWISTYGDVAFIDEAETFRKLCDDHAEQCTQQTQEEMNNTFRIFTKLELDFWNDSFNKSNQ